MVEFGQELILQLRHADGDGLCTSGGSDHRTERTREGQCSPLADAAQQVLSVAIGLRVADGVGTCWSRWRDSARLRP